MKQNKKYFNSLIKTIVESTPSTNLIFQSCLYTFSKMIEDFALLNILLSDSFPKEINKGKIKDIFEILQSQERLDLSQELKNLLLLKTIGKLMNRNIKSWKSSSTCFCDLF